MANSTTIKDLDIDGKEKYGKIMNNYLGLQQKAISQKFDIARLMSEVVKHGGDIKGAIDASNILKPALARGKIRCIGATTSDEYKKH